MAKIILITGGSRSGKSAYAQKLAESLEGPRTYIATCPVVDEEMRQRIRRHQLAREGGRWQTVEEPLDVAGAVAANKASPVLLLDCLTLWVSNLMFQARDQAGKPTEDDVADRCRQLLHACRDHAGTILFVTNEVGLGIVPENELARRYRDLVGRCNQTIAAGADVVTLVVCGLPLHLKGANA